MNQLASSDSPNKSIANNILSEKTQQIFFKKLQKDVEVAIRGADQEGKSQVNIEELKQAFYNMGYLPYLMEDQI